MTFLKKLNELPLSIQFYFENEISTNFINIVVKKYADIKKEEVEKLVREFVIDDFNFEKVKVEIISDFKNQSDKASVFIADFFGIIFYPLSDFIPNSNISKEIKAAGGDMDDYEEYKGKLELALLEEENRIMDEIISQREKNINVKEESIAMLDLFSDNLVDILKDDDEELVNSLNGELIFLFFNEPNFKKDVFNIVFGNQKKLTAKEFLLEGKKSEPTIANWLKDFINKNGSGIFDNLVLSKYITDSENARKLDNNERNLLKKLLILYRNIKFSEKSMPSDNGIGWQIIPVEKESDEVKKISTSPRPSPLKGEGDKASELRAMAEQFNVGSLERRAIEEEICKAENKS